MAEVKSLEYDLGYINAALGALQDYLLSDEVFWPIAAQPPGGAPDYPQLTLDGLLLARFRAEAWPKSPDQADVVTRMVTDLDRNRVKWRVAWEKKAAQCHRVRLRMWSDFLQEYRDNPPDHADRYGYEVRLRVMLHLGELEMGTQSATEIELLKALDGYLITALAAADFIWEKEIQAGFPAAVYWYLYGKLRR